jgi:hypothetical protein
MLLDALYRMVLAGMATLSSERVRTGSARDDRPVAIAIARADAAAGAQATTNLRHEPVALDPAARALLPVMDGSVDHAGLAERLAEEALAGRLSFARDGQPVAGAEAICQVVEEHLPRLLEGIENAGLLCGLTKLD